MLVLRTSTDDGESWSSPVTLLQDSSGQSNNQWVYLVLMVPFYTLLFPSLIVVMASSAETGKVGILSSISIARWTVPFHILFVDYYLREPSTLLI